MIIWIRARDLKKLKQNERKVVLLNSLKISLIMLLRYQSVKFETSKVKWTMNLIFRIQAFKTWFERTNRMKKWDFLSKSWSTNLKFWNNLKNLHQLQNQMKDKSKRLKLFLEIKLLLFQRRKLRRIWIRCSFKNTAKMILWLLKMMKLLWLILNQVKSVRKLKTV